ncbi:MAG: phage tail protein, partial [bacterium]
AVPSTATTSNLNEYYIHTWGHKLHFDTAGDLIRTNISPDVAGCLARTDRDFYPWFSPAGRVRGRILNVVRLETNPTAAQQDTMFDNGINPVVTFPGEGTILFGDKTGAAETSTLSRINVSR